MFEQHWGDLPSISDLNSGIAALERGQVTKPTPMEAKGEQLCFTESLPVLYVEENCYDDISLNTIQLLQYDRKMRSLISFISEDDGKQKDKDKILSTVPDMPKIPHSILNRKPGDIRGKKRDSDFVLGKALPLPVISHRSAWQTLRKSVGIICAHAGFETTNVNVLDILTDITQEFFTRACGVLRKNADKECDSGVPVFVDVMEKTFHDIGFGSITKLHHFYQSRIVEYHQRIMHHCELVTDEFNKLRMLENIKRDPTLPSASETSICSEVINKSSVTTSFPAHVEDSSKKNTSLKREKPKSPSVSQKMKKNPAQKKKP